MEGLIPEAWTGFGDQEKAISAPGAGARGTPPHPPRGGSPAGRRCWAPGRLSPQEQRRPPPTPLSAPLLPSQPPQGGDDHGRRVSESPAPPAPREHSERGEEEGPRRDKLTSSSEPPHGFLKALKLGLTHFSVKGGTVQAIRSPWQPPHSAATARHRH